MKNAFILLSFFLSLFSSTKALDFQRSPNKAYFLTSSPKQNSFLQTNSEISSNINSIPHKLSDTGFYSKFPILIETQDVSNTESTNTTKTQKEIEEEQAKQQKALEEQKERERQIALEKMRKEAAQREKERLEKLKDLVEVLKQKFNDFSTQMQEEGANIGANLINSLGDVLQRFRNGMRDSYKVVLDAISEGNRALEQDLRNMNEQISLWIEDLERRTNSSYCSLKGLSLLITKYQKEDNEKQSEFLKNEIDILKASLPPVLSVCNKYVDCGMCTANPSCGWCSSKSKCVDGDNIGPLKEPCLLYNYDICTGFYCGNLTNCKSCIENPSCGWCDDSENNLQMCLERPSTFSSCPSNLWFHQQGSNSQCKDDLPAPVLDLEKAKERQERLQQIETRKNDLERNFRKWTDEERTIENLQEQIIHWRQEVKALNKENSKLDIQMTRLQNEINQCQ